MSVKRVVEAIVSESCVDLFASVGVSLTAPTARQSDAALEKDPVAGEIAFTGQTFSGSLLLVSTFQFVAASIPRELQTGSLTSSSAGDWLRVRDWVKELCNQLVGRIKNAGGPYGFSFGSRLPIALTGDAILGAVKGYPGPPYRFNFNGAQTVLVFMKTSVPLEGEATMQESTFAREGDVILF